MRKLFFIIAVVSLVSCTNTTKETETTPEERAIGFNTMLPELKFHLGTEEAIQIVKDLDKLWAADNFDAMKPLLSDTLKSQFEDGKTGKTAEDFINILKEEAKEGESSWTFDYAFSVDLDPSMGGEHVQAGFTGTSTDKDGVKSKKLYHESYYIVDGKIITWTQYTSELLGDE